MGKIDKILLRALRKTKDDHHLYGRHTYARNCTPRCLPEAVTKAGEVEDIWLQGVRDTGSKHQRLNSLLINFF